MKQKLWQRLRLARITALATAKPQDMGHEVVVPRDQWEELIKVTRKVLEETRE